MAKQKQHGGPRSFKGALAALVVFVALILIFLWRYSGLATVPAEAPAAQSAAPTATPAPTAAPTPRITQSRPLRPRWRPRAWAARRARCWTTF